MLNRHKELPQYTTYRLKLKALLAQLLSKGCGRTGLSPTAATQHKEQNHEARRPPRVEHKVELQTLTIATPQWAGNDTDTKTPLR